MQKPVRFTLNGKPRELMLDSEEPLLGVIRSHPDINLTGTKYGCGSGYCGTCTVLIDNRPVRACMVTAGAVEGKSVTTIEGLAANGRLHPLQQAFIEHDALQCGYCTPGMIMQAAGLLHATPRPMRDEIVAGMEQNLCRCGAHVRILKAIEAASEKLAGEES